MFKKLLTTITRMWLTRSWQPFTFHHEYDQVLPYEDCEDLGLYIHIPFCRSICHFCPYCKVLYDKDLADRYVTALLQEIQLVAAAHGLGAGKRKEVSSLYFGGGTPALLVDRLAEIMDVVHRYFHITEGVGIELHPDNVDIRTLTGLKEAGVTKISIGIQSFQDKYQDILGRQTVNLAKLSEALQAVPFATVSMDFIFALPQQNLADIIRDIDCAMANGANHVALYPFIDFTFTDSKVTPMPKQQKRALMDGVTKYCLAQGYVRQSLWTYAKDAASSYSSMTRTNFLGFGCSATTLLREQFKINTFSLQEYCKRVNQGLLPTSLTLRFSLRQRMVYYLFWALYTTKLQTKDFTRFFGIPLHKVYGLEFFLAEKLGFLIKKGGGYELTLKGAFYYHHYENYYTLAYIDKMWGTLRKEAFPLELKL